VQQSPQQAPEFANFPAPASLREVLDSFDESIAAVRSVLPQFDDARMHETWRMMRGEQEVLAIPRAQFLRDIMLNHWYQHRGQFGVYLRLLNMAVPASWGPSADEKPNFAPKRQSA
jgi:uncharacterized damage-inducible protein DinB